MCRCKNSLPVTAAGARQGRRPYGLSVYSTTKLSHSVILQITQQIWVKSWSLFDIWSYIYTTTKPMALNKQSCLWLEQNFMV